jgi:hypothetical protein
MARGNHTSPQRTKTNKSRKSTVKMLTLIKQNEQILKKVQNGKL